MKKELMTPEETKTVNKIIKERIVYGNVESFKEQEKITKEEVMKFLSTKYPDRNFGVVVNETVIH